MKLKTKRVTRRLPEYKKVKELFENAFPLDERFPMWQLRLLQLLNRKIDFLAFYDEEDLVGAAYIVYTDRMAIPLYLAVDARLRSKGYGAFILTQLKRRYLGRPLTVECEVVAPTADNYEQRRRRMTFYERNGFKKTGWYLTDSSGKYALLSTAHNFSGKDYEEALLSFTHRLYKTEITQK